MSTSSRAGPVGEFCAKLDELRTRSGADVLMLARRLGLSRAQLYAILAGRIKRPPDWDHVVRPLVDACTGGDPSALAAWRQRHAILTGVWEELRRHDRPPADCAAGTEPVIVPYRGLKAFREQDAALFFGRDEAVARVLELMAARLEGTGLIVVSGVSGAGKSSLLRAGVLPRLRQAGLAAAPEAVSWPCLAFTPGRDPLAELAVRIAPLAGTDAAALRQRLADDPAGFALTARQAALAGPAGARGADGARQRVVLTVDQCEQLFTACESVREREAFITALYSAAAGQCPAALVVLMVRADFEACLADYPQLARAVQDRYLLTAMTRRQLRLAITQPAAAAGSRVEEDLVQVLLEEVPARPAGLQSGGAAGAGALPLLSHALDQAWRTRTGQELTLADYERTGGIEGAVAASAQRVYQALTPAQQDAARQVFTRLTATSSDGADTAIPTVRAELAAGTVSIRDVEVVLERFAAERLLTLDAGTVTISHEVLLTAWPLLRDDWLADARADRIVRARLHATATEWTQASRDSSYLYSGARLEAAAGTADRIGADPRQIPLSPAEKGFLHASHRAVRRRARTRRQLTAVLLALIAALTTVWVMAARAGQAASAQRDIALSRLLISESEAAAGTNPAVSRLEAVAAWALDPSPQARYAMVAAAANPQTVTITADPAGADAVAFSPDGKVLATGGPDGARLWDVATGQQAGVMLTDGLSKQVSSVAFSPDGKVLATDGLDGIVRLWDVATGRQVGRPLAASDSYGGLVFTPDGHVELVSLVAFSPDGKVLATGGPDGARLWDVATGQRIDVMLTAGHSEQVSSVAFSPDGKVLATGDPGGARLWDVATGRQVGRPLAASGDGYGSVAFSPDGKVLATDGQDGAVRLWDVATGRQVGRPLAASDGYGSVAFSPDGKVLATGDPDGARLWDVATGQRVGVMLTAGHSEQVSAVAFSPDGKTLATGSLHETARLWNVAAVRSRQFGTAPAEDTGQIMRVGFSRNGTTLATGSRDGTAELWDTATGRQIGKRVADGLVQTNTEAWALPLAPDGTTLATSSESGVRLRNLATGQQVGHLLAALGDQIRPLAFSPDGKMLVTKMREDGTMQLWDAATGQQIGAQLTDDTITSVAFSPDGRTLASGGEGAQLWDVATGQRIGTLATDSWVGSVAFSPDGRTLATGGPDGAQLWDVATGRQIARPADGTVSSVAFSPDGRTLATTGGDRAELWDVSYLTDPLAPLCSQADSSLTPAEWARYVQAGIPYRNACPPTTTSDRVSLSTHYPRTLEHA